MTRLTIDRRDREVVIVAVTLIALFSIALASHGISWFRPTPYITNFILFGCVSVGWIAIRVFKVMIIDRPDALTRTLAAFFFRRSLLPRYASAVLILVCLVAFMPTFSAMKSAVGLFNDYSWDGTFITLDRRIHGGDPWRLLQPIIGYPIISSILSILYHLWIVLLYASSFYFLLHKNAALRQRYFLSYFLCWSIIGAGLATMFASVGPCFVEPIFDRHEFAPLMHYLRQADASYPILVLDVQNMLLTRYHNANSSLGSGISAMPSMHVTQAFLFFLAVRHLSRLGAWVFGIFFILILIGSVHLAYHYAVDGYVAIIATAVIWKLCGWWANRNPETQRIAD